MELRLLMPPKVGDPIRAADSATQVGSIIRVKNAGDEGEFIVTLHIPGLEDAAGRSATRLEPAGGREAGGSTPPSSAE